MDIKKNIMDTEEMHCACLTLDAPSRMGTCGHNGYRRDALCMSEGLTWSYGVFLALTETSRHQTISHIRMDPCEPSRAENDVVLCAPSMVCTGLISIGRDEPVRPIENGE
eukprot:gene4866-319_t